MVSYVLRSTCPVLSCRIIVNQVRYHISVVLALSRHRAIKPTAHMNLLSSKINTRILTFFCLASVTCTICPKISSTRLHKNGKITGDFENFSQQNGFLISGSLKTIGKLSTTITIHSRHCCRVSFYPIQTP